MACASLLLAGVLMSARATLAGDSEVLEVQELIDRLDAEQGRDAKLALRLSTFEATQRRLREERRGTCKVGKPGEYYKSLDTFALASECFCVTNREAAPFWSLMMIYAQPATSLFGIKALEVWDQGFAELLQRDDLWKGILIGQQELAQGLISARTLVDAVNTSWGLSYIGGFLELPQMKEQVKGKEQLFLSSSLQSLESYGRFLREGGRERVANGEDVFYGEVWTVGREAVQIASLLEPAVAEKLKAELSRYSRRWSLNRGQKTEYMHEFIGIVTSALEPLVSDETKQELAGMMEERQEEQSEKKE